MALVPLRQQATVTKVSTNTGWGHGVPGDAITYHVRAVNQTKTVQTQSGSEVVSMLSLFFDKYPDIGYEDVITFVDEHGHTISKKPLSIEPKRMLSGRPVLTEVNL